MMRIARELLLGATLAALLVPGCQRSLYDWDEYEDSVYRMYLDPDAFDIEDEVRRLSDQIDETILANRAVPPGLRAYLGYLTYLSGDHAAAVAHFKAEKKHFPESSVFVDGLLKRMRDDA